MHPLTHPRTPVAQGCRVQVLQNQGLRQGGLCLCSSPSHSPPWPAHWRALLRGRQVRRTLTHSPSALPPDPTSFLRDPLQPFQTQVCRTTPHPQPPQAYAPLQTSVWAAPFPAHPPAGKTSREPSAEVCRPSGVPASRVQGLHVHSPSICT